MADPTGAGVIGPAPVRRSERILYLDVLRGFAIFGIFIINLRSLSLYGWLPTEARGSVPFASLDGIAEFVHTLLFRGKFYSLFSLLFGIGFAIQMTRATERGAGFLVLYRRRLAILLAIGIIHLWLLWDGDILTLYALLGFVLIALRGWGDRALLGGAAVLVWLPVVQAALMEATGGAFDPGAPLKWLAGRADAALGTVEGTGLEVLARGDGSDLLRWNATGPLWRFHSMLAEGRPFKVLAMFLLGLVVGRRRLVHNLESHRLLLRRVLLWGVAIGLPASVAMAILEEGAPFFEESAAGSMEQVVEAAIYAAGVIPLALAYAAGLALLQVRPLARRILSIFAPVGRMALTNYLLQTIIGIGVFYGVGLGFGGSLGPFAYTGFAILVFIGQVVVSGIWLRYFRFGPAEWVWRRLTYGKSLPLRVEVPEAMTG